MSRLFLRVIVPAFALLCILPNATAIADTPDEFAGTIQQILSRNFDTDWPGLEKLPGIKWAPLPPAMLQNCLPDGGCFTRQGVMTIGGRSVAVIATGARTIVSFIYFRNAATPLGESAIVAALKQKGFSATLARCPVPGTIGGTNWYRLEGKATEPGYLSAQTSCNGRPCEGFSVSRGTELPSLQPNQLKLYSEKCSAGTSDRKPVSTVMPHEQLAQIFATLIPPASGVAFYDWKTLTTLLPTTQWSPGGVKNGELSGQMRLSGREYSVLASGSPTQVKTIDFDENGLHARGEDLLGTMRTQGFEVHLARCGPVYTESTNNWYNVTSPKTRPIMLKQSLRMDGKQVQDTYELRLDATLPKRDPRDRDPGVSGCK